MLELAMKMLFCLLVAGLLGGIIGYILGRIRKCEEREFAQRAPLIDYSDDDEPYRPIHKEVFVPMPDATIKPSNRGDKPISLSSPRGGLEDNLKKISGIGLKVENALYELGIFHYDQIAAFTAGNIIWIDEYFSTEGRIVREDWIGQAKKLAKQAKKG